VRRGRTIQTKMNLVTVGIYCTISPPLSAGLFHRYGPAAAKCSIANGAVCPRLSQRMFDSLWNVVVAHEHRQSSARYDGEVPESDRWRTAIAIWALLLRDVMGCSCTNS